MTPENLLRFCDRHRINGDNGFEEISEQKIIYSETGGACVDTVFWKTGQKA
jgi:hypothetical protein